MWVHTVFVFEHFLFVYLHILLNCQMFYCNGYWMYCVNNKPEGKLLYNKVVLFYEAWPTDVFQYDLKKTPSFVVVRSSCCGVCLFFTYFCLLTMHICFTHRTTMPCISCSSWSIYVSMATMVITSVWLCCLLPEITVACVAEWSGGTSDFLMYCFAEPRDETPRSALEF